jgi:hypothetical protein
MSTYKAKNPCSCSSFIRDSITNRCVRCEEGRKRSKYVQAKNTAPKVSEEQSRLNKELQRKRWVIEDHQERIRLGGMV